MSRDGRALAALLLLALAMLTAGLGLRDAWPADEPRFALVAQEMVASGDWLFPTVGGDLYPDKPPLFFWVVAGLHAAGLPLNIALLLPALGAALLVLILVYDLARRLWSPRAGLLAAALLTFSVQFLLQGRSGQIDGFLLGLTTLSLYGLLRHLLLGPAWGWWQLGWAAAGLGVITKGVGFLPLLVLLPWIALHRGTVSGSRAQWSSGPVAMLAVIAAWLVPMLWVAAGDPALGAYREEILFRQTAVRYAEPWIHHRPPWYFLVEVVPLLWLPVVLLVPWLVPRWRDAWRARDLRVLLPLAWVLLVLVFFSASPGKRDVYILPALPALVLAAAPWLDMLRGRRGVQRVLRAALAVLALVCIGLAGTGRLDALVARYGFDPRAWLAILAVTAGAAAMWGGGRRAPAAWALVVFMTVMGWGWSLMPRIDPLRSAAPFMAEVAAHVPAGGQLGLVGWKEQFWLRAPPGTVHFGFRHPQPEEELAMARDWLADDARRRVLVAGNHPGFEPTDGEYIGRRHRQDWWLISATPSP